MPGHGARAGHVAGSVPSSKNECIRPRRRRREPCEHTLGIQGEATAEAEEAERGVALGALRRLAFALCEADQKVAAIHSERAQT